MLDMLKCKRQINQMVDCKLSLQDHHFSRLDRCLGVAKAAELGWRELQQKIQISRTNWSVAGLEDGIIGTEPVHTTHRPLAVAAAAGSQIYPESHEVACCYLLNFGQVLLYYGTNEPSVLQSEPLLHFETADLYPDRGRRQNSISPELVSRKRTIMTMDRLAELAARAVGNGYLAVALLDGTIFPCGLENFSAGWREQLLGGLRHGLRRHQSLQVPVAGYVSQPSSTDVVNAIRVFVCPLPVCDCEHCPYHEEAELPCAWLSGVIDSELFSGLLQPGEVSPHFLSQGDTLGADHEPGIAFSYLHVGEEVVRLEYPVWVTDQQRQLLLATVYDQARKGGGYPAALTEAREQAVVRAADRQAFYDMLGQRMSERGLRSQVAYKSLRKRGTFV